MVWYVLAVVTVLATGYDYVRDRFWPGVAFNTVLLLALIAMKIF